MATISTFEELDVWKLSREQTIAYYNLLESTPLSKDFELRNQMNRSSGSVMDNIAEGFERSGKNEFRNFLVIAKGSNGEFRSQLYRCKDRNYISDEIFQKLFDKNLLIGKKLMKFITYLLNTPIAGQRFKIEEQPQTSNMKPQTRKN